MLGLDRLGRRARRSRSPWLEGARIGELLVREPHRHDYHELIWVRDGAGQHLIDGAPVPVEPRTVTLIGRGAVHVFERAEGLTGAVLRFGDELLPSGGRAAPGWLLAGRGGRTSRCPPAPRPSSRRRCARSPPRPSGRPIPTAPTCCATSSPPCCCGWSAGTTRCGPSGARPTTPRCSCTAASPPCSSATSASTTTPRTTRTRSRSPPAALSRALGEVTGRSTKELVTDRVMLEAARLLRFTDDAVGEVAHRAGFADPLYFSRAFKRHAGEPPMAYRDRVRGKSMDP